MSAQELRCHFLVSPEGVDSPHPELTWRWGGDVAEATEIRIVVASTREAAGRNVGDLWDTGWCRNTGEVSATYAGRALRSREACYWRVLGRDASATETASEIACWTMGLMEFSDWSALWIGKDEATEFPEDPFVGAQWIWDGDPSPGVVEFFGSVNFDAPSNLEFWGLADDAGELFIDGKPACRLDPAQSDHNLFSIPEPIVFKNLPAGPHEIMLRVQKRHARDPHAGVIARLIWTNGELVTGKGWRARRVGAGIEGKDACALGPFGIKPWHLQSAMEYPRLRARYLRREFVNPAFVERAVLYYSGLGSSRVWINGERIGDEELSPAATDYNQQVFYRTFDVTEYIRAGENAVACILGNGRFFAPRVRVPIPMETFGCPKLRLQLELHRTDGSVDRIVSGSGWQLSTQGAIGWNNEFDGEYFDARKDDSDWTLPGFKAGKEWGLAEIVGAPPGILKSQPCYPIRAITTVAAQNISKTCYGTQMVDFGENLVGRCRLRLRGVSGETVSIRHAEELDSPDALALDNLRSALCTDHVTLKDGITEYTPVFTYHGFRYAEVRGNAEILSIEAETLHDDVPRLGKFQCSDAMVNQIMEAAERGILGNYRSFPTDCPQRDERMGWLGDRAMGASGEMFLFDVQAFYRKWLGDILAAQSPDGCVPDVAPPYWRMYHDNVTWPSCISLIPFYLHNHYGDRRFVAEVFPGVSKWLERICLYLEDDLMGRDIYGDWCVPPKEQHLIHSEEAERKTDKVLLSSAYLVRNLEVGAQFARMQGIGESAEKWDATRLRIIAAINRRFFDPEAGRYDNGSQTSSLLPLALGIVPAGFEPKVFATLVSRITETGTPVLATGLIGIQWLMRTLTAFGRPDLAKAIVQREDYPSWGYMMRNNATTIWELWNGNTADPLMNSRNHVMLLGDLIPWFFQDVAGIRAAEPGFSKIALRPHFLFDSVECWHDSPRGRVVSTWQTKDDVITWDVTIPPGVVASAELPAALARSLQCDGQPAETQAISSAEGPLIRVSLGAGRHRLQLQKTAG